MLGIGRRIKEVREKRGLTQQMLGDRINKSKSAVSSYETGSQAPPIEVLISIASVLNVSLDYLVGKDNRQILSLQSFTDRQKNVIHLIIKEFTQPTNSSPSLSAEQVQVIQELVCLFCGCHGK